MQDPQIPQSIWYYTDSQWAGFRNVRPLKKTTAAEAKVYEPDFEHYDAYMKDRGKRE